MHDSQQPTSPIGILFLKLLPLPCAVLLVLLIIALGAAWGFIHTEFLLVSVKVVRCCESTIASFQIIPRIAAQATLRSPEEVLAQRGQPAEQESRGQD